MFATLKAAVRSHTFGDLTAYPYVVSGESSIFDLSLTLVEDIDQQWWAQIEYNTTLFSQERIGRMLSDYTSLLEGIVAVPEAHILALPVPSVPAADLLSLASADGLRKKIGVQPRLRFVSFPPAGSSPRAANKNCWLKSGSMCWAFRKLEFVTASLMWAGTP